MLFRYESMILIKSLECESNNGSEKFKWFTNTLTIKKKNWNVGLGLQKLGILNRTFCVVEQIPSFSCLPL